MSTLVIHIGAQKCGSTTIQNTLRNIVNDDHPERLIFKIFPPDLAVRINQKSESVPNLEVDLQFKELYDEDCCLILSNEILGNMPNVVARLVDRVRGFFCAAQIIIIGYTRSQYSYYLSEYKQWYFRDRRQLKEDINFFEKNNLLPEKFLPCERRMLVNAAMSFHKNRQADWHSYYQSLEQLISDYGHHVVVKSSHIPTSHLNYSLSDDFFQKISFDGCDLTRLAKPLQRFNLSFNPLLCESVALHICEKSLNSTHLPGPHEKNHLFVRASEAFRSCQSVLDQLASMTDLFDIAKAAITSNFANSNYQYCERFGIDRRYFENEKDVVACNSKAELVDLARELQESRDSEEIEGFKWQLLRRLQEVESAFR